ncbi:hypothetical protein BO85DRAFT_387894 [Aspergillus piperis CBS 112811]|uniref:Zn(2)-C6 fungal-type domain-containing protein n=1 Tax=Aspergillus piperis CBS 112811 TaxID=1448313 RepID=A0A8G1VRW5_9EURO|nr:hypothetical protein BO85DRAFT_387894 [Aspergillus piperis CBS 112811]RAH63514.1 hypothetical protein BO85DRAFT_387894 [Aspergillus piperis CBS 112811]
MSPRMRDHHLSGRTRHFTQSAAGSRGREALRSRTGCPECRRRKTKCDEQKPECGQCLRAGRACRIIDGLFRPHSYSFLVSSSSSSSQRVHHASCLEGYSPEEDGLQNGAQISQQTTEPVVQVPSYRGQRARTDSPNSRHFQGEPGQECSVGIAVGAQHARTPFEAENFMVGVSPPGTPEPLAEPGPQAITRAHIQNERNAAIVAPAAHGFSGLPNSTHEDNRRDRCEVAFFLRHFSEGPGQWMDVCCDHPYFSEQVASLSPVCSLIRYSAVALAAKQLGYMKQPESSIRQTRSHRFMMHAFADSHLDFLWYGAKYYDKAIQIFSKQLSREDRSICQLSPRGGYQAGLPTPESSEFRLAGDYDRTGSTLQILAACILCQYEDLSATMAAWSSHLDGIYRLIHGYLNETATPPTAFHIPQPMKTMDAMYWFFSINDVLDAFVNKRRTRLGSKNPLMWRKMGLPLDEDGKLLVQYVEEVHSESVFFKYLIWLMCKLVNSDLGNTVEWNAINKQFGEWRAILPSIFSSAISWPPFSEIDDAQDPATVNLSSHETWFPKDACALSMAFYHMGRILLLIHRPLEVLRQNAQPGTDILSTYHTLQHDLRGHAMAIISIARGAPSGTVRKYLIQPLYVAGRCLEDASEREELLNILRQIDEDLGVFTDYRQRDLALEWGIPYHPVEKNIVP